MSINPPISQKIKPFLGMSIGDREVVFVEKYL
jgi:hypothetical protein